MFSLKNKNALIIGGAGGLGKPIATAFAQNGANIIIADLRIDQANEIKDSVESNGKKFLAIKIDITNEQNTEDMAVIAQKTFGRIDILVNAAGINILKKAEEYDAKTWDRVININLKGIHLTTKAIGKIMIQQRYGRILNISSVRSILGMSQDYIAYCASKGGVNMYTKQIACEWAKYEITCNAIAPTFTRTPINAFQLDDPEFYNKLIKRIPLGRICTVKDIVAAALYLCSDAASFVTGQILGIDGGITIIQ